MMMMISREYLSRATFVSEVDKLFDSFSTVKLAAPSKTLLHLLSSNNPHIGHWTKAGVQIKSWIFLKVGKPAFKKQTPSQNGWITDICAPQHVWRGLKVASFGYLDS
jgi:hypothetical protein